YSTSSEIWPAYSRRRIISTKRTKPATRISETSHHSSVRSCGRSASSITRPVSAGITSAAPCAIIARTVVAISFRRYGAQYPMRRRRGAGGGCGAGGAVKGCRAGAGRAAPTPVKATLPATRFFPPRRSVEHALELCDPVRGERLDHGLLARRAEGLGPHGKHVDAAPAHGAGLGGQPHPVETGAAGGGSGRGQAGGLREAAPIPRAQRGTSVDCGSAKIPPGLAATWFPRSSALA